MNEADIRKFFLESYENLRNHMPNSLEAPYFEIDTISKAYENFNISLNLPPEGKPQEVYEVPQILSLAFSLPRGVCTVNGGIILPLACMGDDDEQTKAGLLHEQVHDILQAGSVIYGASKLFQRNPEVASAVENFTEFTAHSISAGIFKKRGLKPEKYYEVPLRYEGRAMNKPENEEDFAQKLEVITEQYETFGEDIKGLDPIESARECFYRFLEHYTLADVATKSKEAYNFLLTNEKFSLRRTYNGTWKNRKIDILKM